MERKNNLSSIDWDNCYMDTKSKFFDIQPIIIKESTTYIEPVEITELAGNKVSPYWVGYFELDELMVCYMLQNYPPSINFQIETENFELKRDSNQLQAVAELVAKVVENIGFRVFTDYEYNELTKNTIVEYTLKPHFADYKK